VLQGWGEEADLLPTPSTCSIAPWRIAETIEDGVSPQLLGGDEEGATFAIH
jgi:hypothetical protein